MNRKKEKTGKIMILVSATVMILILLYFFAGNYSSGTKTGYTEETSRHSWQAQYEQIDGTFVRTIYPETNPQEIYITAQTDDGKISILAECNGEVLFEGHELKSGHTHILAEGKVKITITAEKHKGSFSIGTVDEHHSH